MSPKALERKDLDVQAPKRGKQIVGMTVWVDWETRKEIDLVAAYERKKRGPLLRDILIEKVRCYERNPAFKVFLKRLRDLEQDKKKEGSHD